MIQRYLRFCSRSDFFLLQLQTSFKNGLPLYLKAAWVSPILTIFFFISPSTSSSALTSHCSFLLLNFIVHYFLIVELMSYNLPPPSQQRDVTDTANSSYIWEEISPPEFNDMNVLAWLQLELGLIMWMILNITFSRLPAWRLCYAV